jgi:hypothetical protein
MSPLNDALQQQASIEIFKQLPPPAAISQRQTHIINPIPLGIAEVDEDPFVRDACITGGMLFK